MNLFKRRKYITLNNVSDKKHTPPDTKPAATPDVPDGLCVKCSKCGKTIFQKELDEYRICIFCGEYFRLTANERIELTADEGSFVEFDSGLMTKNPLSYPNYNKKIDALMESTGLNEAIVTGTCLIDGIKSVICAMDSRFIMGSMGSVVGEKVTRAFEYATKNTLPIIIFTVSGGARMQEGIISLMQMAKVSAAAKRHAEAELLYVTVITDPTTGGVTASFAMLGDIIIAEPKALIGFAGRRVIEQTIKQHLPDDFQTAEFLLEHGFLDKIVPREEMTATLRRIVRMHV